MTIKIYLTNLGKYNEGQLIGEWVELPTSEEELEKALERIGINEEYEEYFITDYETEIEGLKVGEYDNLEELNELAELIENLDSFELDKLNAVSEATGYDIKEIIENLDDYDFYPKMTLEDLAYQFVDDGLFGSVSKQLENYIDYEAIARDLGFDYIETDKGIIRVQ